MENLQLVLFVLGAVAIIAVLVHGFWSIRRQQPKSLKESPMTGLYTEKTRDSEGFDADGIGPVTSRIWDWMTFHFWTCAILILLLLLVPI